jgi:hypothetical protein
MEAGLKGIFTKSYNPGAFLGRNKIGNIIGTRLLNTFTITLNNVFLF